MVNKTRTTKIADAKALKAQQENELKNLNSGRRLARRRMAWFSFGALLIEAAVILAGVFLGGPAFAINVKATSALLTGLFWAQAAVVGAYLGVSLTETLKK